MISDFDFVWTLLNNDIKKKARCSVNNSEKEQSCEGKKTFQ